MEHRHIPASKDGSIPSAKTRFWRGEDNFLEDVWYGRCAICGELIRPRERSGISVLPLIPVCTVTVSIGRRIV